MNAGVQKISHWRDHALYFGAWALAGLVLALLLLLRSGWSSAGMRLDNGGLAPRRRELRLDTTKAHPFMGRASRRSGSLTADRALGGLGGLVDQAVRLVRCHLLGLVRCLVDHFTDFVGMLTGEVLGLVGDVLDAHSLSFVWRNPTVGAGPQVMRAGKIIRTDG